MTQTLLSDVEMNEKRKLAGVCVDNKGVRYYGGTACKDGKIVSIENVVEAFGGVMVDIGEMCNGEVGPDSLIDSINYYKAVRFCFGEDTTVYDNRINMTLDYLEFKEYKLIN